jgi:LCP family protein required for cell wall assembly
VINARARRRRKLLAWTTGGVAVLLLGVMLAGYAVLRHFNDNLTQANVRGLLGRQPADLHPQAENILVLGSTSRLGLPGATAADLTAAQSDTMMLVHIPASRQWAEVMSIPRDSWVSIPSCRMGDGQMSSPAQFKIDAAFAVGYLYGNHEALAAACSIKAIEQDTGIYVDHFIVVRFTALENIVAELGGVEECNPTAFTNPASGIVLSPGRHWLNSGQALAYVRARQYIDNGSDLDRIARQQAFIAAAVARARSEWLDPLSAYRFLDAVTSSLTIDSQLGGVTGLYNLEQSLRGIPSSKIALFTLPTYPRIDVVPSDTSDVLWPQPEDSQIFASFRDDVPASGSLFAPAVAQPAAALGRSGKFGVSPSASPGSVPVPIGARTASQGFCVN